MFIPIYIRILTSSNTALSRGPGVWWLQSVHTSDQFTSLPNSLPTQPFGWTWCHTTMTHFFFEDPEVIPAQTFSTYLSFQYPIPKIYLDFFLHFELSVVELVSRYFFLVLFIWVHMVNMVYRWGYVNYGSIICTATGIHPFWKLRNMPEGGHAIGHHLPQWRWRFIVSSKYNLGNTYDLITY